MTSTIFPWAKVSHMAKPKVKEVQGSTNQKYREIIPSCIPHVRGTGKLHCKEHESRQQGRIGAEKSMTTLLLRVTEDSKHNVHKDIAAKSARNDPLLHFITHILGHPCHALTEV